MNTRHQIIVAVLAALLIVPIAIGVSSWMAGVEHRPRTQKAPNKPTIEQLAAVIILLCDEIMREHRTISRQIQELSE